MKKLSKDSTTIFCRLLEKLGSNERMKLKSEGFMDLVFEKIGEGIRTPLGRATYYSLAHYFELNSDLVTDPEMCFLVIDNRQDTKQYEAVGIYAQSFKMGIPPVYEESIYLSNDEVTNIIPVWQNEHTVFANIWLKNIRMQGFLKAAPIVTE